MITICNATSQGTQTREDFVHLHGHTKYSARDSTSEPKLLVERAKELGMTAIAVTDHGIASGWIEMAKLCKEADIKFIPGVEMYETDDRTLKTQKEMTEIGVTKFDGYHFLMIAKSDEGLKNLNRIVSDGSMKGHYNKRNRTDMDTIEANGWGKGIIATTACIGSRSSQLILEGRLDEAKAFNLRCANIFDGFYLELQENGIKDQRIINEALIEMSKETGIPLVLTQDYHYVDLKDEDMHDNWICVGWAADKDPNKNKYPGGPYHLASSDEMWELVDQGVIPEEAYLNAAKIAEECNVAFDFKKNRYPKYNFNPIGYDSDSHFKHLAFNNLWAYAVTEAEKGNYIDMMAYTKRLQYETEVICDKGYSDYFLILEDLFRYAEKVGILIGPGRGSGAGSLVAYLLDITGLDPIVHKLLFERFLNPERMSSPDIDFDIQHDRRNELFEYIRDKYGSEHVAQIVTYGKIKLRSATDHLCRIYKEVDENDNVIAYGMDVAETVKKSIPGKFPDQTEPTYAELMKLADAENNPDDLLTFKERFREQTPRLITMAIKFKEHMEEYPELHEGMKFFEGLVDNYGRHAAAVVITNEPITDHVPIYITKGVLPVTAFAMKEIDEDLQMLKLDALSLKTLTVIQKAVDLINNNRPQGDLLFRIRDVDIKEPEVYKLIRGGHTAGVFQISGGPITQFTKRVKPQNFNELTDILALKLGTAL